MTSWGITPHFARRILWSLFAADSPSMRGGTWCVPSRKMSCVQHITSPTKASEYSYHGAGKIVGTRGELETVSAPLFPRYIFTVVDRSRDRWRSINGTFGVDRLLMSGGEPQPVPHGLVESLIRATDAEGNVHFGFALREGQNVKVIAGPFANLIGSLEKLDERGRVRVLLELLGATIPVALPAHLVAPS